MNYFYNSTIRKAVAIFGDMFSDIYVARHTSAGLANQKRVPISYALKEAALDRINEKNIDLEDERTAISLPRMSFHVSGSLIYDSDRQLSSTGECQVMTNDGLVTTVVNPAPYSIPFELNIYGKTQNDVLQIVEQILPEFRPSLTQTYYPIDGQPWTDQITFTLQTTSVEDTFNTDFQDNRVIIYTLSFEARLNIYGFINTNEASGTIKRAIVNFTDELNRPELTLTQEVNPSTANEDEVHDVNSTKTYGFDE